MRDEPPALAFRPLSRGTDGRRGKQAGHHFCLRIHAGIKLEILPYSEARYFHREPLHAGVAAPHPEFKERVFEISSKPSASAGSASQAFGERHEVTQAISRPKACVPPNVGEWRGSESD